MANVKEGLDLIPYWGREEVRVIYLLGPSLRGARLEAAHSDPREVHWLRQV